MLANAETLFHQALEIEPRARAAFLQTACGSDSALRQRVAALLAAHEQAEGFLREANAEGMAARPRETPLTETPGTMVGRYKLLEKLGEGGFGVVWAAEQREPIRRRVALKIIKLGMDTKQVIARFEAERQALALMDHSNIAKVLDAGATDAGRPYFVMELVRGIPITHYCEEQRLGNRQRVDLFIKICHAIQHAHQKGIIHRDIKPSNIMVTLHDGVPVPKVIDFGIAKATQSELTEKTIYTQYQQFIGTPAYMSPEQAEMSGLDIDTRSDIYSLGVMLYELLTGKTPFDGKDLLHAGLDEMRRIIREQEPVRPSTRLSKIVAADVRRLASSKSEITQTSPIDSDLDWIVMKCLEKDRTRRYETANGLATDLVRHLNDETVIACPPSATYRLQKAFRRNKLKFAAATAVVAALVVGLGISLWQATVANRARKDGEHFLYAAKMNLAQQMWEENNVGRVRQLLAETASYPDRGFEWYYWQRQTHLEIKTLRGHSDGVWSIAYSKDGRHIVTGSSDHTAKVWDAATGQEIHSLEGHSDWVAGVAFSPDGRRVLTGSSDQTARIWDAATGKLLRVLKGHNHWITSVAFSPDGQRLITGSHDNTAIVWDAASGVQLLTLEGHGATWGTGIAAVAFSLDGARIVTGAHDRTAKLWDAATGNELGSFEGHTGAVCAVALSGDGRFLATGSYDRTARMWEVATCKLLDHIPCPEISDPGISSVAFSPDGQRLAIGSWTYMAKVWDISARSELFPLKGHSDGVSSVAFSPDGKHILTGSRGHTAKIWDAGGTNELNTLRGQTNGISAFAFSPDGERLVTASYDKIVTVWNTAAGKELFSLPRQGHEILTVAFSHDGRRLVTGGRDWKATIWDVATRKELFMLEGHGERITSVAFSADDRRILTGSYDHTAKLWDAATGNELHALRGHTAFINCVALSPDGRRIITGSYDGTAIIWDAIKGRILHTLKGSIPAITSLHAAFVSGAELTIRGRSAAFKSAAFSPDGRRLVTGSQDGTASVWDPANGQLLLTLQGHSRPINSVGFSPDSRRIITGSLDNTVKLWGADRGEELLTLSGHTNWITSALFFPDGNRIVTASLDGTAKIWQAATPAAVAAWHQEETAADELLDLGRSRQAAADDRNRALRARDHGIIKQWLLLGPIVFTSTNALVELDHPQIPREAALRPRVGDQVQFGDRTRIWHAVQLEDYLLDFKKLIGEAFDASVAYAVCYVQSDIDQNDVVMKLGSDDRARVFLNGREILRRYHLRTYIADQDAVSGVELKAGINILILKIAHQTMASQASIRLTDAADQPLKGITVTLDPGPGN